jgi:hypothetical protein
MVARVAIPVKPLLPAGRCGTDVFSDAAMPLT